MKEKKQVKKSGEVQKSLLVIGAGASGMLAAVSAREAARQRGIVDSDFRMVILERNPKQGAKIRISGGGKCNLTHDAPVDLLLQKGFLRKNEQRFLRHALYGFTSNDLLALFARYGVKTAARPDGRVFPVSGQSAEVLDALQRMLRDAAVELCTGNRVESIEREGEMFRVRAEGGALYEASSVIIACGGSAWGSAGTTGDGFRLAASLGHGVVPVFPALAPVFFTERTPAEHVGVSLRGVQLVVEAGSASACRSGDLLLSHRGISGPACLSLSRTAAELLARGTHPVRFFADLFPWQDEARLSALILGHAARFGSQLVRKFLQSSPLAPPDSSPETGFASSPYGTIPNAIVPALMHAAGLDADLALGGMTKQGRRALVALLKKMPLGTAQKIPLDKAEVSAGGVSLSEIDPRTMESRLHRHLCFCGEVLDYAGEVGGFNLQAAFSTGWLAGKAVVNGE